MHIVWHALKESLILLPFLLISYIVIEVIEYVSAKNLQQSKLLSGKFSNLFAASFGLVPQCGFSVVATDLFSSKKIRIGTLLAVYIATSDEAIPLLLVNPDKISFLAPLLLIKFALAIIFGYLADLIFIKLNRKRLENISKTTQNQNEEKLEQSLESNETETHDHLNEEHHETHEESHDHKHENTESAHHGCCGHDIDTSSSKTAQITKQFILHPLIHTLKIFAFILAFNLVMGLVIHLVGEDKIYTFLDNSKGFAPLLSTLIGLIPNCASSVILTDLFLANGISFGAYVGGLIANAGIGLVILFKQNRNQKENFAILGSLILISIIAGYAIQLIGF